MQTINWLDRVRTIRLVFEENDWRCTVRTDGHVTFRFLENLETGFCDYPDWNATNSAILFEHPELVPEHVKALCRKHLAKRISTTI